MKKQRTFKVNGQKIKLVSNHRTSCGNANGFFVWINNQRFYCNSLYRNEAEDYCYAKWVKLQPEIV